MSQFFNAPIIQNLEMVQIQYFFKAFQEKNPLEEKNQPTNAI